MKGNSFFHLQLHIVVGYLKGSSALFGISNFRYYIQAEEELDCSWIFMKGDEDDDASWFLWLKNEL